MIFWVDRTVTGTRGRREDDADFVDGPQIRASEGVWQVGEAWELETDDNLTKRLGLGESLCQGLELLVVNKVNKDTYKGQDKTGSNGPLGKESCKI